jgi:hypothetical protein
VKVLLDENFPLGLIRQLQADGLIAEHIITIGWRGASDTRIRERLQDSEVLFLTQDEDFLFGASVPAVIVISRVRQARPLKDRIEVWRAAIRRLIHEPKTEKLFELTDEGVLLPWRDVSSSRRD